MGSRSYLPQTAFHHRSPRLQPPRNHIDSRAQLLQGLQQFFELSRDQFDYSDLETPEWRQADDALERTYDACAARAAVPAVRHLCGITRSYIEMAIEMSTTHPCSNDSI
ncbi:MAG: hypothetical protein WCL29_04480 [Pseudomonadota bacterium]